MKLTALIAAIISASTHAYADPIRVDVSGGTMVYKNGWSSDEAYVRVAFKQDRFDYLVGFSATNTGDVWAGVGSAVETSIANTNLYAQGSFMVGYWNRGYGPVLGFPIEFRTGLEVGYEFDSGIRFGVSYDHRSNAGIGTSNAGVDTAQIRVGIPFTWNP